MTHKSLYCTILLCIGLFFTSTAQKRDNNSTKQEERFHDKENSRFVNEAETLQAEIQRIRDDKSLSSAEKKAKIKPIYDRMNELREENIKNRNYDDAGKKGSMKSGRDIADSGSKGMDKKSKKQIKKDRKKETKRLKKEIKRVKKNKTLTEFERVTQLESLQDQLAAVKSGKSWNMASRSEKQLKTGSKKDDMSAEKRARDQWDADQKAKRKETMNAEMAKQKNARDLARQQREKNIEEWKAKARKEAIAGQSNGTMAEPTGGTKPAAPSTSRPSAPNYTKPSAQKERMADSPPQKKQMGKSQSEMNQTAAVQSPDSKSIPNQVVTQKSRLSQKGKMLARVKHMTTQLNKLKDNGLINERNYKQKMAHIRAFREKVLQ